MLILLLVVLYRSSFPVFSFQFAKIQKFQVRYVRYSIYFILFFHYFYYLLPIGLFIAYSTAFLFNSLTDIAA